MADIELVIKIPDKAFENLQLFKDGSLSRPEIAVKYGTPLPKGHGRLLILDERCVNANSMKIGNWSCQKRISEVGISNSVVTIIEADKAETEIRE